jgi:tRNA U34 5-carboxymethylaminomethyl modifying enzyme MnmG/GidA
MREEMVGYKNLSIVEGSVADIIVDKEGQQEKGRHGKITGVRLEGGHIIPASNVVITTGTFLGGEIHIGEFEISVLLTYAESPQAWKRTLQDAWAKPRHLDSVNRYGTQVSRWDGSRQAPHQD